MSSSPSSVSGAAPDEFNTVPPESGPPAPVFAMTVGEWHYFKTGDGYWMRSPVTGGRAYAAICSDVLDELFAARAASREEPSDTTALTTSTGVLLSTESYNSLIARSWLVEEHAWMASTYRTALLYLANVPRDHDDWPLALEYGRLTLDARIYRRIEQKDWSPEWLRRDVAAARFAATHRSASSSPSAASPELAAVRAQNEAAGLPNGAYYLCEKCHEVAPMHVGSHDCAECGTPCVRYERSPIPSREDARDAARWRFVKPHLGLRREHIGPDVWAHWLALEGESARSGLVDLYHGAMDVGGVDGAVDCAIQSRIPSAVSHPEAQTNGN